MRTRHIFRRTGRPRFWAGNGLSHPSDRIPSPRLRARRGKITPRTRASSRHGSARWRTVADAASRRSRPAGNGQPSCSSRAHRRGAWGSRPAIAQLGSRLTVGQVPPSRTGDGHPPRAMREARFRPRAYRRGRQTGDTTRRMHAGGGRRRHRHGTRLRGQRRAVHGPAPPGPDARQQKKDPGELDPSLLSWRPQADLNRR